MSEKATSLEIEGASIVILGTFNPAIFHHSWLLANDLISEQESEETEVKRVHPALSSMFLGKWLDLEVMRDRLSAICTTPPSFQTMRDLVQGIMKLLEHTPVTAIGMNFERTYSLRSEEKLTTLINKHCPSQSWTDIIDPPGFKNVEVSRTTSSDNILNLKISLVDKVDFGLFIGCNYHRSPEGLTALQLIDMLNKEWKKNYEEFRGLSEKIIEGN